MQNIDFSTTLKEIMNLINEDSSILLQACAELEKVHRALYTELQFRKIDELNARIS